MALTEEEIKNLKPGDTIFLNNYPLTFRDSNIHGDVLARDNVAECNEGGICWFSKNYLSIDNATENKPKHDPCRLFKKGDMVQPRSGKTVLASEYGFVTFHELAGQYEVNEDEARGTVTLIVNGRACFVSAFALELVTPVEEMQPYSVEIHEDEVDIMLDNKTYLSFPYGDISSFLKTCIAAKKRAEAECARLNEEWRKGQK